MGRLSKALWNVVTAAFTLWTIYESIVSSGQPMKFINTMEIHPPVLQFFTILGIVALIALNYSWISSWLYPKFKTKRTRLGELHPEIENLRANLCRYRSLDGIERNAMGLEPSLKDSIIKIIYKLNKVGVECPFNSDIYTWHKFLTFLSPTAEYKDFKTACTLYKSLVSAEEIDEEETDY